MLPTLLAAVDAANAGDVLTRAAESRDWWTFCLSTGALALLNLGAIALLRKSLRRIAFFRSGLGARVLTWAVAAVGALLLALAGGLPPERALTQAIIAAASASGGRSWKPRRRLPAVAAPPKEATP